MSARSSAGLALLPFAAVCLLAAACSRDVSGLDEAPISPGGGLRSAGTNADSAAITITGTAGLPLEFESSEVNGASTAVDSIVGNPIRG